MNQTITINNNTLSIEYQKAEIVHSDKYNRSNPLFPLNSIYTNLFHDIIFKANDTHEEFFFTVKNSGLRTYIGQQVTLISIDKEVVAYLDEKSNYYYLTNRFAQTLDLGISLTWAIIASLIVAGILLWKLPHYAFPVFLGMAIFYFIYLRIFNYYIGNQIDRVIENG